MTSIVDPHYLWAFGHAVVLLNSLYITIQTVLFRGPPTKTYRLLYIGALLSYSIVVFKSLGKPTNAAWLRRAFVDENAQYALLAFYWLISKPVSVTIIPFATFSLFHCATFLRTNILPKFYPKPPAGATGAARPPANFAESLARTIQTWVKGNYDKAMIFVAYAELAILARVTLGALTFRSSFIAPLFLAHFIRLRYHASPFTRTAVDGITAKVDAFAAGKPGVLKAWDVVKRLVGTWGGGNLVGGARPAAAPGAGAGAAPAPAAAGAAGARR